MRHTIFHQKTALALRYEQGKIRLVFAQREGDESRFKWKEAVQFQVTPNEAAELVIALRKGASLRLYHTPGGPKKQGKQNGKTLRVERVVDKNNVPQGVKVSLSAGNKSMSVVLTPAETLLVELFLIETLRRVFADQAPQGGAAQNTPKDLEEPLDDVIDETPVDPEGVDEDDPVGGWF